MEYKMQPIDLEFIYESDKNLKSLMRVTGEVESYEFTIKQEINDVSVRIVNANIFLSLVDYRPSQRSLEKCKVLSPCLCIYHRGVAQVRAQHNCLNEDLIIELDFVACRLFKDMNDAKTYLVTEELKK